MRPEELKNLVVALRELSASYKEMGDAMKGVVNETKFLKRLIGETNPENQRSWLIAAGIALIAFPDPTITDLIGTIMVVAGLIKNRMKQLSILDVYKAFQGTIKEINEITQELHTL
ncbi:MAG: hypothetical protein QW231_03105 [Candidatus Bathyarchaeia archaeon]